MKSAGLLFLGMLVMCIAVPAFGAEPALLGSASFLPTAEHPVGWRGDSTGLFPGATPPMQWSRRVQGITSDLRYQAGKPNGEPAAEARQLEYFTLKDWLVAGPFSVSDPVKDLNKDFIGGEAAASPVQNAKVGDTSWKFLRVGVDTQSRHEHNDGTIGNLNVDFLYTFGTISTGASSKALTIDGDFANKVAYAHTYIYAPNAAQVRLVIPIWGTAGRFWLNGKATDLDPKQNDKPFTVELAKGWNRLLVKVSAANGLGQDYTKRWLSGWRFAAYLEPAGPVSYQTKNVAWMTRMTGRSVSQPIVVGEKIFLQSNISDLVCLDKNTGKILWIRSSSPYDALTAEQKQALPAIKETIEPLRTQLEASNADVLAAINATVSPQGMTSEQQADMDKKLRQKKDIEHKIHVAFAALDKKTYPPLDANEVSPCNATPTSDGQFVYCVCGGGTQGTGANVISCFDLNGKRIWSFHEAFGCVEHGTHLSPSLAEGKVIFAAKKTLIALDAKTGKELWRNTKVEWDAEFGASSPIITSIGSEKVIVGMRYLYRLSDGTVICKHGADVNNWLTPVVVDGVLVNPYKGYGGEKAPTFMAVKLPASTGAGAKTTVLAALDGKEANMLNRGAGCMIASPLLVDGVAYSVDMGAGLAVVDIANRKCLYRQWLDGYDRYNRMVFGVAASPTFAGGNIYITDDAGYTHIIAPGPQLKELARNVLESIHSAGQGGNPCQQESFYTAPFFQGSAMYLRGEEYLYCITEKPEK